MRRHGVVLGAGILCTASLLAQQPDFAAMPKDAPPPARLASTPVLDGRIAPGEWMPFVVSEGVWSFLQWDGRGLYVAAVVPVGSRLVASIDAEGNGWLVGADNIQVTASEGSEPPEVRLLDATGVTGPAWREAGLLQRGLRWASGRTDLGWVVEMFLPNAKTYGLELRDGKRLAARFDATKASDFEPFVPRVCAPAVLVMDVSLDTPPNVTWKSGFRTRKLTPGEELRVNLEIANPTAETLSVDRVQFRGLGTLDRCVDRLERALAPIPPRGKLDTAYVSRTSADVPVGFHVLDITVLLVGGGQFSVQCSFEVMPRIRFEWGLPEVVVLEGSDRSVSGWVRVCNNTSAKLNGSFDMALPPGWTMKRGQGRSFVLYGKADKFRVGVEFVVPASASGTYRLQPQAKFVAGSVTEDRWIEVRAPAVP